MIPMKIYYREGLYDLYKILGKQNPELLNKKYPELMPYKDNLFKLARIYQKQVPYGDFYDEINWTAFSLQYISITENKEFIFNDKIMNILGDPELVIKKINQYFNSYICLLYPEDLYNYSVDSYITFFNLLIKAMAKNKIVVNGDFSDEFFVKNPKLTRFLKVVYELKTTYHKRFNNLNCRSIISILLGRCYLSDNYDLLYEFLNNYKDYIDKLALRGYIEFDEDARSKWAFYWKIEGKERTFNNADNILREYDIAIR